MPELTQIKLVNGVTYDIADAKCRDNMPKSLIDLKEDAKSVHVTQYEKNKWNALSDKDIPVMLSSLKESAESVHVSKYEKDKWNSFSDNPGLKVQSVDELPINPDNNTIYLIRE